MSHKYFNLGMRHILKNVKIISKTSGTGILNADFQ